MKQILSLAVVASLAVSGSAQPHHHGHHHAKRSRAHDLNKRVLKEVRVDGPTVIAYELAGVGLIPEDEAKEGIESGLYVIVGESSPESSSEAQTTPTPTPTPTPSAAVFKESENEDDVDVEAESVWSSTFTSSSSSSTTPSATATSMSTSSSGESTTNMLNTDYVDAEFPDGELSCDSLPSGYGAISADWLDMSGWLGLQWGTSNIVTGVAGDTCTSGAYCSYLCPEGYQKSQWPETQGSSLESIGGLYCNSDGKLELTRPSVKTLCQAGMGDVWVKSSLSETVYVCRTDYPGTEAMLIPIEVTPDGTEYPVTNPDQTWYLWNGGKTSAQYYLNKAGYGRDDACVWDSAIDPTGAGDKAPTNFGTGMDDGITYFGLFPNSAVSSAVLDYNVRVTVDGEETCTFEDGVYSEASGCTGAATSGKKIVIELY